jgi:hypothetical protein
VENYIKEELLEELHDEEPEESRQIWMISTTIKMRKDMELELELDRSLIILHTR